MGLQIPNAALAPGQLAQNHQTPLVAEGAQQPGGGRRTGFEYGDVERCEIEHGVDIFPIANLASPNMYRAEGET